MPDKKTTVKKVATKKPVSTDSTGSPQGKVEKTAPKKETKKATPEKSDKPEIFAIIKTGGKQYLVQEGRWYDFEKLDTEEGKEVSFDALLIADKKTVKIGNPLVAGAKVTGKVLSQFKDEKITVLKYKPKKRYRKNTGHRQSLTRVQITKIA